MLLFAKEIITLAVRPITYYQHNKMNQNKCAFCQEDEFERLGPLENKKKKTDIDSNCKLSRNIDQYVHKCLLLSSNVQVDLKEKKSECENIQLIGAK